VLHALLREEVPSALSTRGVLEAEACDLACNQGLGTLNPRLPHAPAQESDAAADIDALSTERLKLQAQLSQLLDREVGCTLWTTRLIASMILCKPPRTAVRSMLPGPSCTPSHACAHTNTHTHKHTHTHTQEQLGIAEQLVEALRSELSASQSALEAAQHEAERQRTAAWNYQQQVRMRAYACVRASV